MFSSFKKVLGKEWSKNGNTNVDHFEMDERKGFIHDEDIPHRGQKINFVKQLEDIYTILFIYLSIDIMILIDYLNLVEKAKTYLLKNKYLRPTGEKVDRTVYSTF